MNNLMFANKMGEKSPTNIGCQKKFLEPGVIDGHQDWYKILNPRVFHVTIARGFADITIGFGVQS